MKTSPERVEKLLAALRPVYSIMSCMLGNEHPGDDALAMHALEAIKRISTALYPFPDGSDLNEARAMALGAIRATAELALKGEPPRLAP